MDDILTVMIWAGTLAPCRTVAMQLLLLWLLLESSNWLCVSTTMIISTQHASTELLDNRVIHEHMEQQQQTTLRLLKEHLVQYGSKPVM